MLISHTIALLSTATIAVNALTINSSSLLLPNLDVANTTNLGIPFQHICVAAHYPGGISPESCADALLQIDATDRTERTYAVRLPGGGAWGGVDVSLPRGYISREFLISFFRESWEERGGADGVGSGVGDGRCVIDVRIPPFIVGRLSTQRLTFGLLYVLDDCLRPGRPGMGGVVRNMGEFSFFGDLRNWNFRGFFLDGGFGGLIGGQVVITLSALR